MTRTEILQYLIDNYRLKSYVEVGTQRKINNFDKIKCQTKMSIDPDLESDADIHLTSDQFFKKYHWLEKKDIIFLDGLHHEDQLLRDIENSLANLSDTGFIVCHDCNPPNELVQRVPRESKQWVGSCWQAIVKLREREDLNIVTVDTDWGCTIIEKLNGNGKAKVLNRKEDLTYENLDKNRKEWLNLISVKEFKEQY